MAVNNRYISFGVGVPTYAPPSLQDESITSGKYKNAKGEPVVHPLAAARAAKNGLSGKCTKPMLLALIQVSRIYNAVITSSSASCAVGCNDRYAVAEIINSSRFDDETDFGYGEDVRIVIDTQHNGQGKKIMASINGKAAKSTDVKAWHVFFAMSEFLKTKDADFAQALDIFCTTKDYTEKKEAAIICCDYMYIALASPSAPYPITDEDFLNVGGLNATTIAKAQYAPDTYSGVFKDFVAAGRATKKNKKASRFIKPEDWNGRYRLVEESFFTPEEKALIPVLDEKYVISQELDDMAKMIKWAIDSDTPVNFNNILLRSAPGYGKSTVYVILAAAFGLPLRTLALNAMSEPLDLIGSFVPISGEIKTIREMAGKGLPSADDIYLDPEWAYEEITGKKKPGATAADCQNEMLAIAARKAVEEERANNENADKVKTHVEFIPGIIPAMARPCMIGLDEISMPMNAGVVPTLHPLMDDTNAYTLPTGEVVTRHPMTIMVSTTNLELEGNRAINQAFMDRNGIIIDMEAPGDAEIKERLIKNTRFDPTKYPDINIDDFVRCYKELRVVAAKNRLSDGVVGPRKLSHWLLATMAINSPRKAAEMTIIPGGTADENGKAALREKIEAIFAN